MAVHLFQSAALALFSDAVPGGAAFRRAGGRGCAMRAEGSKGAAASERTLRNGEKMALITPTSKG